MVELNRRLYMDEWRIKKHLGFHGLKSDMSRLIKSIRDFAVPNRQAGAA